MANTTAAKVFQLAPGLVASYPKQVTAVTVVSDDLETTVTIDDTEYTVSAGGGAASTIAATLGAAIEAALSGTLTVSVSDAVITLTSVTSGEGFTAEATANVTVADTVENADIVQTILADVAIQVTSAVWGSRQEEAQRYLAAHLLTRIAQETGAGGAGPVTSESAGSVSISYAVPADLNRYDSTFYGQRYMQLRKGTIVPLGVY